MFDITRLESYMPLYLVRWLVLLSVVCAEGEVVIERHIVNNVNTVISNK